MARPIDGALLASAGSARSRGRRRRARGQSQCDQPAAHRLHRARRGVWPGRREHQRAGHAENRHADARHSGPREQSFPRLLSRPAARQRAASRPRLRLHREPRRLHPHQCARRRERGRSDGAPHRPTRAQGEGGRLRQAERHRGPQDRREEPAHGEDRRLEEREARRMANGWRRSARPSASRTR